MERGAAARHTLKLVDVLVDSKRTLLDGTIPAGFRSLGIPPAAYTPTIVDSGTTFVYAPTRLWSAMHQR